MACNSQCKYMYVICMVMKWTMYRLHSHELHVYRAAMHYAIYSAVFPRMYALFVPRLIYAMSFSYRSSASVDPADTRGQQVLIQFYNNTTAPPKRNERISFVVRPRSSVKL